jgi:methyltransferase-like protein
VQFWLASPAQPVQTGAGATSNDILEFRLPDGKTLSINNPLVKSLLLHLGSHWPRRFPFDDVCMAVCERLNITTANEIADTNSQLPEIILQCFLAKFLELHVHSPEFALQPDNKPLASPVARLQVQRGLTRVVNLLHFATDLQSLDRLVLPLLDGTRDRAAVVEVLVDKALTGSLDIQEEGVPVTDPRRVRELLEPALDATLEDLAATALLIR